MRSGSDVGREGSLGAGRWRAAAALAAIVAWAAFARWRGLVGPFGNGWQWLGSWYGMQARNLLRYGPVATRFAGVVNADRVPSTQWLYYMHHPPGTLWSMAASMGLFGDTALATKLPAFLASLGQVVVTFLLVARILSMRAGLVAALMTATLPAGAIFATHGSELGPCTVLLSLCALLLDERARAGDPARPRSLPALAAFLAAALFSWAALPIAVWIALRDLAGRRVKRALLFGLAIPTVFALHLLHVRIATGSWNGGARESMLDMARAHGPGGMSDVLDRFGVQGAMGRVGRQLRQLFTSAGLAVAIAGALLLAFRSRIAALRSPGTMSTFLGLLVFALGYSLPFPEAVWFHTYWLLIALPHVSFGAALIAHVLSTPRWLAGCVAVGFLGLATWSTIEVRRIQAQEQTPYYEELGSSLRALTNPGTRIISTETQSSTLTFYADREIVGNQSDADLAEWRGGKGDLPPRPAAAFALVTPGPVGAPPSTELEALLRGRFVAVDVDLPRSTRHLTLFDLSRLK